jgi:hypothetical protein
MEASPTVLLARSFGRRQNSSHQQIAVRRIPQTVLLNLPTVKKGDVILRERTTCNQKSHNDLRATEGSSLRLARGTLHAADPAPSIVLARSFGRRQSTSQRQGVARRLPQDDIASFTPAEI